MFIWKRVYDPISSKNFTKLAACESDTELDFFKVDFRGEIIEKVEPPFSFPGSSSMAL